MANWRRKIEEYEADLYREQKSGCLAALFNAKTGEMEFKRYDDGEKQMEIELHGLKVPDGAAVSALVDGAAVCEVTVQRGHGRAQHSTSLGENLPDVSNGSVAEVHYMGEVLLKGTFRPD